MNFPQIRINTGRNKTLLAKLSMFCYSEANKDSIVFAVRKIKYRENIRRINPLPAIGGRAFLLRKNKED